MSDKTQQTILSNKQPNACLNDDTKLDDLDVDLKANLSEEKNKLELSFSVTDWVAFACQTGDLERFSEQGPSALEGIRAHQKIQRSRGEHYLSEERLSLQRDWQGHQVTIQGRVDGIITVPEIVLEEIKSTYCEPDKLSESVTSVQWAQLKVYGWLFLQSQHPLSMKGKAQDSLQLQMTWVNLKDKQEVSQKVCFSIEAINQFAETALSVYCQWLVLVYQHRKERNLSCQNLSFPHESFRAGQKLMSAEVFRHIRDKTHLMINAPTGIGKSISTLFPSLKAMGKEFINQIVFLTAKTSGRRAAFETCQQLAKQSLTLKSLVINAKESSCFCSFDRKAMDEAGCLYQKDFYRKLPGALFECFQHNEMDHALLIAIAKKHKVCPFTLSLQLVPWVDVVLADYNYVLDPLVKLAHFNHYGQKMVVLIDEAHNLIDRSRNMYSATLSSSDGFALLENFSTNNKKLSAKNIKKKLTQFLNAMESNPAFGNADDIVQLNDSSQFIEAIRVNVLSQINAWTDYASDQTLSRDEQNWVKQLIRYRVIDELAHERFQNFMVGESTGFIDGKRLLRQCLNASEFLNECYKTLGTIIYFSGTLSPKDYIKASIGIDASVDYLSLTSPFKSEQSRVLVSSRIDTRYQYREHWIGEIVDDIFETITARKGNYLVGFSSYRLLNQVKDAFILLYGNRFSLDKLLVQSRQFTVDERHAFIDRFHNESELTGFVIMGGTFTEGIDFKGDALHGVIIVGAGLPQMNLVQDAIKEDFDQNEGNGFDMAYRFPGLQRVLQTAGRVIRSESDKGIILLLDKRFLTRHYQSAFPPEWQVKSYSHHKQLSDYLSQFWQEPLEHN